jgi:IS5 family transposase
MNMYKFASKQMKFSDFNQPLGLTMNPNNRWIKKAQIIPWDQLEKEYAALFTGKNGEVAKPLRLALGALLIQIEYGYSDEETVLQIQENPYLQFFCGLPGYEDKPPFDASLMVHFRKRLTAEILQKVNEKVIAKGEEKPSQDKDDDQNNPPKNSGTLLVDATCAPSNIKYPQDTELLNEARENLEKMIDMLHDPAEGKKPRTYPKQARKAYLSIARKKKKSAKEIRKAIRKQLQYIKRDLRYIDTMLKQGKILPKRWDERLQTIRSLYEQQQYMYQNKIHKVSNRIVNLRQPYIRPIVRGKAKAPVEFGIKLDISVVNGFVRLEHQSFDAYNESEQLKQEIERYRQRYGYYPERVLADKIYRNRENLNFCKENGIRLSGPALGRPKKDAVIDKKQEYQDTCERVEVERAFSLTKRKFGMGLIRTYLEETSKTVIALSVLALNLHKVFCALFFAFIGRWFVSPFFTNDYKNMAFVQ